jgi:AhpD family alkylhydroperoxidase
MTLDDRMLRLIAVGASVGANCQPCLQTNIAEALKSGADEQDIAEAIEVGKRVRRGAAAKMDAFVASLKSAAPEPATGGCGCSSESSTKSRTQDVA